MLPRRRRVAADYTRVTWRETAQPAPAIFKRVNFRVMRLVGGADQMRLIHVAPIRWRRSDAACLESCACCIRALPGPVREAETSTPARGFTRLSPSFSQWRYLITPALLPLLPLPGIRQGPYHWRPFPSCHIPFLTLSPIEDIFPIEHVSTNAPCYQALNRRGLTR